jgi:dTDP-4-dehydrorhamnose 3,5-epimerase-like enzyme
LAWNDPDIGITWPLGAGEVPVLSEKDRSALDWPSVRKLVAP